MLPLNIIACLCVLLSLFIEQNFSVQLNQLLLMLKVFQFKQPLFGGYEFLETFYNFIFFFALFSVLARSVLVLLEQLSAHMPLN